MTSGFSPSRLAAGLLALRPSSFKQVSRHNRATGRESSAAEVVPRLARRDAAVPADHRTEHPTTHVQHAPGRAQRCRRPAGDARLQPGRSHRAAAGDECPARRPIRPQPPAVGETTPSAWERSSSWPTEPNLPVATSASATPHDHAEEGSLAELAIPASSLRPTHPGRRPPPRRASPTPSSRLLRAPRSWKPPAQLSLRSSSTPTLPRSATATCSDRNRHPSHPWRRLAPASPEARSHAQPHHADRLSPPAGIGHSSYRMAQGRDETATFSRASARSHPSPLAAPGTTRSRPFSMVRPFTSICPPPARNSRRSPVTEGLSALQ